MVGVSTWLQQLLLVVVVRNDELLSRKPRAAGLERRLAIKFGHLAVLPGDRDGPRVRAGLLGLAPWFL
jgi:hypothetical protein